MPDSRIPQNNVDHHIYVQEANEYLHEIVIGVITKGEHLGMTVAELTKLDNLATTNEEKYNANANKKKKNTETAKEYDDVKNDFNIFFRPILNRISGSTNISSADRLQLNIAEPVQTHSAPGQITAKCNVSFTTYGGGKIKADCRADADQSRPSKPEGADAVEIAERVDQPIVEATQQDGQAETSSSVKRNILMHSDDGTSKKIRSKASFTDDYGDDKTGYYLQMFARWINTKHPQNNGPWTGPFGTTIL